MPRRTAAICLPLVTLVAEPTQGWPGAEEPVAAARPAEATAPRLAPTWEGALHAGGMRLRTVLHLRFQECRTGAIGEYGTIEQTMAPAALDLMTEWIRARAPAQPAAR
jgi:hypothetical protein